ncbi:acyl-CoA/acyl-ACP dehydrogenase [Streptomyces sp. NRRL B-1347]|uniref:acyl-CoA/acyl-ACP dehydrogenase n=1 Tax=Streptomyces sp. NRRL B-1347 TaxID=1476877 RepID=UPI0004C630A3|nr:acyl-CoA/acyl-ACP dehydrogenase [Streptomyces sp. NRRL B-1347]
MRFLERERATVEKLLPGLDESLRAVSLMELESPSGSGIQLFQDSGGPGLLAPAADRGLGGTALDALRVQRALGSRSPSLAMATTVHHFSMATLVALAAVRDDLEWMLVEGVAASNRLVAFGFAEESPDAGILSPSMTATVEPDGVSVNGVTHLGRLVRSMDLLMVSVMVPRSEGPGGELAIALVPAESEGVSVSEAGAKAGSQQVTLQDVLVAPELLVRSSDLDGQLGALLTAGFAWFQLLMTGSCLGAASALIERVLLDNRVPESERVQLLVEAEGAMSAAEGIARRIDDGAPDESTLAQSLYVRYGVQDTLSRVVPRAVELLGDHKSTASEEADYLATCANKLALHPPTRSRMTGPLAAYLVDGPLTLA